MTKHPAPPADKLLTEEETAAQLPPLPAGGEPEDSPELQQAIKASKTRKRQGFRSVFIHIRDEDWAKIQAHLDTGCLDEGKWLTKQFTVIANTLEG
jgi:hypothetical protein